LKTLSCENMRTVSPTRLARGRLANPPSRRDDEQRPRTVGECRARGLGREVPCGFLSCGYHLALSVDEAIGSIQFESKHPVDPRDDVPDVDVAAMPATCALAVAERGPQILEAIGAAMDLTREAVRKVEMEAHARIKADPAAAALAAAGFEPGPAGFREDPPGDLSGLNPVRTARHRARRRRR
jgi:hypothetical protein